MPISCSKICYSLHTRAHYSLIQRGLRTFTVLLQVFCTVARHRKTRNFHTQNPGKAIFSKSLCGAARSSTAADRLHTVQPLELKAAGKYRGIHTLQLRLVFRFFPEQE